MYLKNELIIKNYLHSSINYCRGLCFDCIKPGSITVNFRKNFTVSWYISASEIIVFPKINSRWTKNFITNRPEFLFNSPSTYLNFSLNRQLHSSTTSSKIKKINAILLKVLSSFSSWILNNLPSTSTFKFLFESCIKITSYLYSDYNFISCTAHVTGKNVLRECKRKKTNKFQKRNQGVHSNEERGNMRKKILIHLRNKYECT